MLLTLTGCGHVRILNGNAKLPHVKCPAPTVELDYGWLGPLQHTLKDGTTHFFFALTAQDKGTYQRYIEAWIKCAEQRGLVLEELRY